LITDRDGDKEKRSMADKSEEEERELEKAYDAAMEEEWKMKTLENDLTPIVKKIIIKNYPETFKPDSKEYGALDDVVWKHIDKLVRDVKKIANTVT
jgi:hypothetical protein